jgi:hypothetical protein
MFGISSEQLQDLLHPQLASTTLSTFKSLICELPLLFLEIQDPLFNRVFDCDFIDNYVDFLGETVNSVDCLFFNELSLN